MLHLTFGFLNLCVVVFKNVRQYMETKILFLKRFFFFFVKIYIKTFKLQIQNALKGF